MKRIRQLIACVKSRFPEDIFFDEFELRIQESLQAREMFRAYERALFKISDESWPDFLSKVVVCFMNHREGQLKQGFFTRLNEAFAYEYLSLQGFEDIRFVPEGGRRSPDLSYVDHGELKHCEVKTICVSNDELDRAALEGIYDTSVYLQLSDEFLAKLLSTVVNAGEQINSRGTSGLIYIILFFDDFTLRHYDRYKLQISQLLEKYTENKIFIKVGLLGGLYIRSHGL